jgi:hypothetical protein
MTALGKRTGDAVTVQPGNASHPHHQGAPHDRHTDTHHRHPHR